MNHRPASLINSEAIQFLRESDPIFVRIQDTYGLPPDWRRPANFVTLLRIILEQQVSLESAYATYRKLVERLGPLTPKKVLSLDDTEMKACYVSRQKARYLRILAQAILNKELNLDSLVQKSEAAVRQELTSLTGIGNWTADIYLMFCLQEPDILPLGDVAVRRAMLELKRIDDVELLPAIGAAWSPFRSTATYFLWHYYLKEQHRDISGLVS